MGPRTGARPMLFLVVDAVPWATVVDLHARGATPGFGAPRPLVAPFPSLTNVSVPRLVYPFRGARPPGYESVWFHPPSGTLRGGVTDDATNASLAPFRGAPSGTVGYLAVYTLPSLFSYGQARWVTRAFGAEGGAWLGWITATDGVGHFQGPAAMQRVLVDLFGEIARCVDRYEAEHGERPGVVLCSDHGMRFGALRHVDAARVARALASLDDVTVVAHGAVGGGAVFCRPGDAAKAAEIVARIADVDVAVARIADDEALIVSRRGRARLQWRPGATRYVPTTGDPLDLPDIRGWIDDRELLARTWDRAFPYAPARLRDGLVDLVEWPAPVLFSMVDEATFGPTLTHAAARARGGQIGTHGALSRAQTLGFAACTDEDPWPPGALRPEDVFLPWADRLVAPAPASG